MRTLFVAVAALLLLVTTPNAATIDKGPYVQNVDTTGVTICWTTDFVGSSIVEFGATRRVGQRATAELNHKRQVWTSGDDVEVIAFHEVRIDGLVPDTRYYYRVRTDDVASDIFTFTTAVKPGTPFRFVAWGDSRPMGSDRTVMHLIDELGGDPRFLINNGDIVSYGQRWPEWREFFTINGARMATTPLYPALGNHEDNADAYFHLFSLPGNERWYSFDYGDVHVITLDSNAPYRSSAAQRDWLIRDLRAAYDKPYIFIQLHHPIYSCTNQFHRRVECIDLQQSLAPIFEAAEVTAVFSGHDHSYQHNVVNDIHYIVTGGGGATLHDVRPRSFTVTAARAFHLVQVDVGTESAEFTVYDADDGSVIERFTLPRRDTTPKNDPRSR
jgi:hypothetical protein